MNKIERIFVLTPISGLLIAFIFLILSYLLPEKNLDFRIVIGFSLVPIPFLILNVLMFANYGNYGIGRIGLISLVFIIFLFPFSSFWFFISINSLFNIVPEIRFQPITKIDILSPEVFKMIIAYSLGIFLSLSLIGLMLRFFIKK